MKKKSIIVRAPVLSRSGYGEQARFALRALRAHEDEYDIHVFNINWGRTGWIYEESEEREWLDSLIAKTAIAQTKKELPQFDLSLQVTIPNEWERMAHKNIGYTAGIETTQIALEWIEKSNMMDQIIVVSNHAKSGFETTSYDVTNSNTGENITGYKCTTPVHVVNYPIRHFESEDMNLELETDFNFLCVSQWGPRKNLENTVLWFCEEFQNDEVGLILKVNQMNNSIIDFVQTQDRINSLISQFPNRKCKIYFLHGDLSDEQMTYMYNHPKIKALISLAHGEGYGLPMFEAAYNGMPVIAPNWSGQNDFLYAPAYNKKKKKSFKKAHFANVDYVLQPVQKEVVWKGVLVADSMWCYPRKGNYKMKLRDVYKSHGQFKSLAKKLKTHLEKNFTAEQQYNKFIDVLKIGEVDNEEVDQMFNKLVVGE